MATTAKTATAEVTDLKTEEIVLTPNQQELIETPAMSAAQTSEDVDVDSVPANAKWVARAFAKKLAQMEAAGVEYPPFQHKDYQSSIAKANFFNSAEFKSAEAELDAINAFVYNAPRQSIMGIVPSAATSVSGQIPNCIVGDREVNDGKWLTPVTVVIEPAVPATKTTTEVPAKTTMFYVTGRHVASTVPQWCGWALSITTNDKDGNLLKNEKGLPAPIRTYEVAFYPSEPLALAFSTSVESTEQGKNAAEEVAMKTTT